MKPYKTVIYSFLLGGLFALIAQALFGFWNAALTGTAMEFFKGGAVLVSLGIIGFILGGSFGIGTLICAFLVGPVANIFLPFNEKWIQNLLRKLIK